MRVEQFRVDLVIVAFINVCCTIFYVSTLLYLVLKTSKTEMDHIFMIIHLFPDYQYYSDLCGFVDKFDH